MRLPLWIFGLTAMLAYFAYALGSVLDESSLASFAALATNPVMALVGGPGFGFDHITTARFLVGLYGGYLMIGMALMSILTVSRHTRVEEQSGRAELLRAGVVGNHAQLIAAILLTTGMNVITALLMSVTFYVSPTQPGSLGSSILFGCSLGALGLVFTGVSAVTVQLSSASRAASGMAGAILAASFIVRGFGDMSRVQSGGLTWLSWLSPFGWSQQTAPLVMDRWWPLGISVIVAGLLVVVSVILQARRDLDAGLLHDRLGAATAPAWLGGPLALAFRLQRTALAWWSFALLVCGLMFGAFVNSMADNASGMPDQILQLFGGAQGMVDGYLGFMAIYISIIVAVQAILAMQSLRTEEDGMHTERILSTAVSRARWLVSWICVVAAGSLWLLFLGGLGEGIGAALSTSDWSLLGPAVLGHVAQVPAIWVLIGLAAALYGVAPRLMIATWVVFVYSTFFSFFGEMLGLSNAVLGASIFRHVGQYPAEPISWPAVLTLTAIAAALAGFGTLTFKKRDLESL